MASAVSGRRHGKQDVLRSNNGGKEDCLSEKPFQKHKHEAAKKKSMSDCLKRRKRLYSYL